MQEINQLLTENSTPLYEWIDKNLHSIKQTKNCWYANLYCPKIENCYKSILSTLRKESSQPNVILQYKLLESLLGAVCSVIQ